MKKSFLFTLLAVATLLVTALGMQASPAAKKNIILFKKAFQAMYGVTYY